MVADRIFFFSLGRAAIIGSLCLAILGEYMSVGHSRLRGYVYNSIMLRPVVNDN